MTLETFVQTHLARRISHLSWPVLHLCSEWTAFSEIWDMQGGGWVGLSAYAYVHAIEDIHCVANNSSNLLAR